MISVGDFLTFVSTDDFDNTSLEDVCDLLSSNNIEVHDELEVFMSAVKWLMHNFQERQKNIVDIMKSVRFGLMQPWQLVNIRRNPCNPEFVAVASVPEVRQMIQDGCNFTVYWNEFGSEADKADNSNYWLEDMGLIVPEKRHFAGNVTRDHISFQDFLEELKCYRNSQKQRNEITQNKAPRCPSESHEPSAESSEA